MSWRDSNSRTTGGYIGLKVECLRKQIVAVPRKTGDLLEGPIVTKEGKALTITSGFQAIQTFIERHIAASPLLADLSISPKQSETSCR